MRARYTAYALGDESFLLRSWHPITRPLSLPLDTQAKWLGLTVLSSQGGSSDSEGTVEFIARYKVGGRAHRLQERSRFLRQDKEWYYLAPVS